MFTLRILIVAALAAGVPLARAQTTDGSISTQSNFNWSAAPWAISGSGSYPGGGGRATFLQQVNTIAGTAPTGSTLTIDVPIVLSGLTFDSVIPYTIAASAGNSLALSSTGTNTFDAIQSALSTSTLISNGHVISAPITGGGSFGLTKTGAGTITLSGTNTYTGGTHIDAGTLNITSGNAALGATGAGNDVSINGGTLRVTTTALTTARNFNIGTNGATVELYSAATINGVISGNGSLVQRGASTLTLTAANSYTGSTTLAVGNLTLSGAGGSITSSSSYDFSGVVTLDNATANNNNRLSDSAPITSRGAIVMINGNVTAPTSETAGALALTSGFTTINVTPNAAQQASLNLASITRQNNSTLFVRGTNLGGTPANGVAQITSATAPGTLVGGGGAAGSTSISVLPWAVGNTSTSTTLGSSFVTYDSATGRLRPLATTEYLSSLASSTAGDNVRLTGTTVAPASSTVNALLFAPATTSTLSGGTITITSGAFLFSPTNGVSGTVSAPLNFGTAEGIISATQNLSLSSVISGTGGLTINPISPAGNATFITMSGASTYTGTTTLLGGFVQYSGVVPADGSASVFGTSTSAIVLNPGATVTGLFATSVSTLNRDLSIQGSGGALARFGTTADFALTVNGNIDLQRSLSLEGGTTAATAMTINGRISGTGSIGDGFSTYVILNGNNDYSGGTNIGSSTSTPTYVAGSDTAFGTGTISFSAAGRIQGSGTTSRTIANNLFLGATPTFQGSAPLTFLGTVNLNGSRTISVTNTAPTVFAGPVSSGGITKTGTGLLGLSYSGGNTYAAGTILGTNAGTLLISNTSGSATGLGAVFIGTGSTLAGNGFIDAGANQILINGNLSPGGVTASADAIHLASAASAGALTLSSSSKLVFDLGSASDLVALTTTSVNLGAGTLQLNLGAGFDYANTYTLFSDASSVTGNFATVTGYDAATYQPIFSFDGENYEISFAPVPEPGTWVVGFLACAAVFGYQRKRILALVAGCRQNNGASRNMGVAFVRELIGAQRPLPLKLAPTLSLLHRPLVLAEGLLFHRNNFR